jgi:hypothetical protein
MNDLKKETSVIIGLALIISSVIFGAFYYKAQSVNNADTLSVTGSAKTRVTSDQAKIVVAVSRTVFASNLSSGYAEVAYDINLVRNLLKNSGVSDKDMVESPVSMNQMYDQNSGAEIRYQLIETVTIQSNDVTKITDISKKIPSLSSQGAMVSTQSLEYYYSKLPDLRVSLLEDAVKDAKLRAEKIAAGTGRRVGSVRAASSGVVQVLSPNSVDISDYGNYDTSSVDKDVMVTVKASFDLK